MALSSTGNKQAQSVTYRPLTPANTPVTPRRPPTNPAFGAMAQNWQSVLTYPRTASVAGGGGGGGGGFTPMEGPDLEAMKQREIDTALGSLRAKYRSVRSQLQSDRDLLKLSHQSNLAASRMGEREDLDAAISAFAARGTARSGFAAEAQSRIAAAAATERAAAIAQYRATRGEIQQQLKQGLIDQRSAEEAERLAAIEATYALYALSQPMRG